MLFANKVVKAIQEDPTVGLTYNPGLKWPTEPGETPQICIAAVSDASQGNEEVFLDEWQEVETFRSQGAKLIFLADSSAIETDQAQVHLVSFASSIQQRVVNSTIKAETFQLTDVVEAADLVRAAIADAHGAVEEARWETTAAAWTTSVWFTDCRSCYDTLQKPIAKTVNKRLGIELAGLRQHLWRDTGFPKPDRRALEEKPNRPTDVIRWIDTAVMVADALTKLMQTVYLQTVLDSNVWCFAQTPEAKAIKARKQAQRKKGTASAASQSRDSQAEDANEDD